MIEKSMQTKQKLQTSRINLDKMKSQEIKSSETESQLAVSDIHSLNSKDSLVDLRMKNML